CGQSFAHLRLELLKVLSMACRLFPTNGFLWSTPRILSILAFIRRLRLLLLLRKGFLNTRLPKDRSSFHWRSACLYRWFARLPRFASEKVWRKMGSGNPVGEERNEPLCPRNVCD